MMALMRTDGSVCNLDVAHSLYFLITRSIGMGGSSMRDIVPRFAFILTYWSSASVLLVRKLVSGESLRSPARLQQQPSHSLWKRTNRYL